MRKQHQHQFGCVSLVALMVAVAPAAVEGQSTDLEAAALLLGGNLEEQVRAIEWARSRPLAAMAPALRDALITTLDRSITASIERRREWARGNSSAQWREEMDITPALLEVVTAMRDHRTIPVLARSASTGWMAIGALLGFGEDAVPALYEVALSRHGSDRQVSSALYTLRMIVDEYGLGGFQPETIARIREVAADRLNEPHGFIVLRRAIDLASTLNDPELDGILQSLASDRASIIARGLMDPDQVKEIQKQAGDRLAGVPARGNPRH